MKTSFSIDGFSFSYEVLRRSNPAAVPADKWLDWRSLATTQVGPNDTVHKIHSFTATIERTDHDPEQGLCQETCFRVPRRISGVQLHYGLFKRRLIYGELVSPRPTSLGLDKGRVVRANRYDEKGSDVNLATRLVEESFAGEIDHAIASARKWNRVSVISPHSRLASDLARAARAGNAAWILDASLLNRCRLPNPARGDAEGWLVPPDSWLLEAWPDIARIDRQVCEE